MTRSTKASFGKLFATVLLLAMSVGLLVRARHADARHSVVFMPDDIGGAGDTFMYPGQAYLLAALCGAAAIWLLFRFFRDRRHDH
jgi:hypothetical protein